MYLVYTVNLIDWYFYNFSFYRMLVRGRQILTWSCSVRPLLLLRESHLTAFSEHAGTGWHAARELSERRYEGSPLSTETVSCSTQLYFYSSDCGNHQLREQSFKKITSKAIFPSQSQTPQVSASGKCKLVANPVVEDLAQNPKAVSAYQDCLTNTTCLQPCSRLWHNCQPSHSFTNKTHSCTYLQSHLYYRQHFVRPFSSSTLKPWILKNFLSRWQTRALHQTAPHVVDAWRDCLSLENENRCRLSLEPNLKLYEVEKRRKGANQSQGKNQGKCASVLVSLCSVEGEPAFLFTLRSSTLKGRHKGDVRLVES